MMKMLVDMMLVIVTSMSWAAMRLVDNMMEILIRMTYIKLAVYVYLHVLLLISFIALIVCMVLHPRVMRLRIVMFMVLRIRLSRVSRRMVFLCLLLCLLLAHPAVDRSPRRGAELAKRHGRAASGIWSASPSALNAKTCDAGGTHGLLLPCLPREVHGGVRRM